MIPALPGTPAKSGQFCAAQLEATITDSHFQRRREAASPAHGDRRDGLYPPTGEEQQALTSLLTTSQLMADPAFLLLAVGTAIRSDFAHELTRWQLRPLQYQILLILSCVGGLRQHELCQALGITKAHLAGLIDGLRALNCVSRSRDGRRRRYIVTISPAGMDVLTEARKAIDEYARGFFVPLTSREEDQFTDALRKLYVAAVPSSARPKVNVPDGT